MELFNDDLGIPLNIDTKKYKLVKLLDVYEKYKEWSEYDD
jgi:hypothetical protein